MVNMNLIKEILIENVIEYADRAEKYDRMKNEYTKAIKNAESLMSESLLNSLVIKELKESVKKKDKEIKSIKRKRKKKYRRMEQRLKAEIVYIKAMK